MNLGKLRVYYDRAASYVSIINFLMLFGIFISGTPLGMPWYIWLGAICVALVIVLIVDLKIIYPQAQEYVSNLNPEWCRLREAVERLEAKMNGA